MTIQSSCAASLGVIIGLIIMVAMPASALCAPLQSDARIFLVQPTQYLGLAVNPAVDRLGADAHYTIASMPDTGMRAAAHDAFDRAVDARGDDDADLRSDSHNQDSERKSEEESILDIALMMVFAAGMFAYPLVRKQRALLHTSVLTTYV